MFIFLCLENVLNSAPRGQSCRCTKTIRQILKRRPLLYPTTQQQNFKKLHFKQQQQESMMVKLLRKEFVSFQRLETQTEPACNSVYLRGKEMKIQIFVSKCSCQSTSGQSKIVQQQSIVPAFRRSSGSDRVLHETPSGRWEYCSDA